MQESGSTSRRRNNNITYATNPSRAVQNWQSNLDREIELKQLTNGREKINSRSVLDNRNSNESQQMRQQNFSQRQVQTIMIDEKSKVPLSEILQLEP